MDDRQRQIREQAGLTESRLNQDFIDFLRKYSTPVLVVVMVAAGGFWLLRTYQQRQAAAREAAFAELSAATTGEPSPDALAAIADAHAGVPGVAIQALLSAGDSYFTSAVRGVKPGAQVGADGTLVSAEDAMTPEDRAAALDKAKGLYERAVAKAGAPEMAVPRLNGLWGLAAVAETKGDFDGAKRLYERIVTESKAAGYDAQGVLATQRLATLDELRTMAPLVSRDALPQVPGSEAAVPAAMPVPAPVEVPTPEAPAGVPDAPATTPEAPGTGAPGSDAPATGTP
jgi:hypothetical protein